MHLIIFTVHSISFQPLFPTFCHPSYNPYCLYEFVVKCSILFLEYLKKFLHNSSDIDMFTLEDNKRSVNKHYLSIYLYLSFIYLSILLLNTFYTIIKNQYCSATLNLHIWRNLNLNKL